MIQDIPCARNISDDIIVFGKTPEEHDTALEAVFKVLLKKGLTLNREKCRFNQSRVEFFGLVFSKDGVSPDSRKVDGIQKADRPQNQSEVRSLLGMANYCSRFIRNYATLCEPLRRLTRNNVEWSWTDEQECAFVALQRELTSDTVMAYFDPAKDIEILVDASPFEFGRHLNPAGPSSCLCQPLPHSC